MQTHTIPNERWNMLLGQPHLLLLFWWVVVGLVFFGGVVAIDQQLLQIMLRADRSHICLVLLLMYAIGVAHTFKRTLFLSTELGLAATLADRLRAGTLNAHALQSRDAAHAAGLKTGFVVEYLSDLRAATPVAAGEPGSDLLDAYATRLRGAHEFGWFYIDLLLKAGFLGTLVGFILMLSSVAETGALDAGTMQKVLTQMSVGMSTALYTTLASLVAGILLSIPYYLLDRGLEALLQITIEIRDVLLPPSSTPRD